jgi:hypothetical protein
VVHDVRRADIRLNRGVLLLCNGIASLKKLDVVVVAPYVDDGSRAGGGGGGDINGDVTTAELSSSSSSCSVFDMVWYIIQCTRTQLSFVSSTRYKI